MYGMKPSCQKIFLEDIKRKYSTMDARKKKGLLSQRNEKLVKARSVELCINRFKRKIREGSYFICTVCNQILYKKSVITGREIAPNTGANAPKFFTLATKS